MAKDYKALCEELYEKWKGDKNAFCDFRGFQTEFLIEPYYKVQNGKKMLYVINNNPGEGLGVQHRNGLWGNVHGKSYAELSSTFMDYYEKDLKGAAKSRLNKIQIFASRFGFDGIEDVESFFLHSKAFNKKSFLKKINNPVIQEYCQALQAYLENKSVLSINSVGVNESITKASLKKSLWIMHIAEIINLDFSNANLIKITSKGEKVTSTALVSKNKIMIFTMGSNNMPKILDIVFERIQKEFL